MAKKKAANWGGFIHSLMASVSRRLLPPSPPAEQAAACQDQT
jgi:hypothetical protein